MFTSGRLQHLDAVVLGVFAALSPLWLDTDNGARWSLIVLGLLIAATGLAQMFRADLAMADYATGLCGALLFVSPWVMGFDGLRGAAWTAWIVGALTVLVALAEMPAVQARFHRHGGLATHS